MTEKIKCKCGLELFEKDIVETIANGLIVKFRCPRCFTITEVEL